MDHKKKGQKMCVCRVGGELSRGKPCHPQHEEPTNYCWKEELKLVSNQIHMFNNQVEQPHAGKGARSSEAVMGVRVGGGEWEAVRQTRPVGQANGKGRLGLEPSMK